MDPELARQGYNLGKDVQSWKVSWAQKDLLDSGPTRERIVPILYRPFDVRYTYYTGRSNGFIARPIAAVMRHMLAGKNLAITFARQVKTTPAWQHCLVADCLVECCYVSNRTSEIGYVAPLYLYPTTDREDLFSQHQPCERQPNLNPALVSALTAAYGKAPTPEDIFNYVYAVLYAPSYRTKYAEFLKSDFPRIPFTADADLFAQLAALGERLVALHLLKSPELDPPACRFEGAGNNRVEKDRKTGLRYDVGDGRVYINASQYFAPVPESVWTYQIGGYQVCEKWLKDRKERHLELDDIRTYCRIVTALGRTIELQNQIDGLYPEAEKETVRISSAEA